MHTFNGKMPHPRQRPAQAPPEKGAEIIDPEEDEAEEVFVHDCSPAAMVCRSDDSSFEKPGPETLFEAKWGSQLHQKCGLRPTANCYEMRNEKSTRSAP